MNIFVLRQDEISALVMAKHNNPHHILGMHESLDDLYVNAYMPGAASISVINTSTKKEYQMQQLYHDGFYTVKIDNMKPFDYMLKVVHKVWGEDGSEQDDISLVYDAYSFPYSVDLAKVMDVVNGNDDIASGFRTKSLLGARFTDLNGIEGVSFCMNMPGAVRVSVVGDMNNWDGRINQMRKIDYTDVYELFIPGKHNNCRYKFEALYNDGRVDIFSDPYAASYEKYPGNASVLAVSSYKWNDEAYMNERKKKKLSDVPVNIYEVHMPTWKEADTDISYRDFGKKLSAYMKSMNYNYVSFLPLMEYNDENSWGYDTIGRYAPTSRFGMPDDFMAMVDIFHENGIGVIMDMVPVMDADCMAYWIETYHLDGIRLDNQELAEQFNRETGNKYKDIMIGCKWNTNAVSKLTAYMSIKPPYRGDFKETMEAVPGYADGADGIIALCHDEVSYDKGGFIEKMPGGYEDKYSDLRVLYGLCMTMPGRKLIFMGQEYGLFGGFNGKLPLDWSMLDFDANMYIQKYVKDLNKIYLNEPSLYEYKSEVKSVKFDDEVKEHMAVFRREGNNTDNTIYVVCNFGIKDIKNYSLNVAAEGKYKEVISSDNIKYGGAGNNNKTAKESKAGKLTINVPALSIAIFKKA